MITCFLVRVLPVLSLMYLAINSLRPVKERQKKWGLILQDGNWITLSTDRQTAGVSRDTFNTMTHKLADRLKKIYIIQHLEITCNITNWTEGGTLLKSWSHVKRKVVWHFSKLRTLVRSHRNTSVSYREIFFKQISKEYIYLFYPWVFTRLFHTSLNSAHMALKPNYKEYLKTEPRFFFPHAITSTLDILHKQVVQRTGFYFGLSLSSISTVQRMWFIKPYLFNKLQLWSCKNHLWSMRSAKSVIMLSQWKISPSVLSVIFSAKSRLLGFCGWKSGQRERLNCRIIMNNGLNSAKLADINLHQQNWSRCAFMNTQKTMCLDVQQLSRHIMAAETSPVFFTLALGLRKAMVSAITIKVLQAISSRLAVLTVQANHSVRQSASRAELNCLPILR